MKMHNILDALTECEEIACKLELHEVSKRLDEVWHELKKDVIDKPQVLKKLSNCINDADEAGSMGFGDDIMQILVSLKELWHMFDDEED